MIIFIFFLLFANCYARGRSGQYECGLHGRFEYCIDGFPGCVVGCHCYPGYYFDTETKICEPNTKLTKEFTRRLAPADYGSSVAQIEPAPAAPTQLPSQNADPDGDLSDWLYNQFFKTIENQVINNNKTDDDELLKETRRSGGALEPVLTRRNKIKKNKKSYKHANKHDLRKKLLRISEDDSLFDSSSSDSDSDSSSSSDESESNSLGSWERFEWGAPPNLPGGPPDRPGSKKEPAAHRQIVVYSKKPKPPLPSFIFLPNMQPYYTPLGLPAPPAMPMYPLVPVPPISCPAGQTDCAENDGTTSSGSKSETTPTPTVTTTTTSTTTPTTTLTTVSESPSPDPTDPTNKALRHGDPFNFRANSRKKPQFHPVFKPPHPSPRDYHMKQYPDYDPDSTFLGDNNLHLFGEDAKTDKLGDDPDFKYISQLIHKDYNQTTTHPPLKISNPMKHRKLAPFGNKKRPQIKPGRLDDTRRRFDPRKNGQDDSYYSTLGRQIATLIRGIESKGIRDADIKIEAQEMPKHSHPFFSENSFAARTYWERFVRSPLDLKLNQFKQYDELIGSNEQLFDLETKVQKATAAPPLSWLELENIINTMGSMRNQMNGRTLRIRYRQPSNSSLNVSLLPRHTVTKAAQHVGEHYKMLQHERGQHTLHEKEQHKLAQNILQKKIISNTPTPNMISDKFLGHTKPDPYQTVVERVTSNNTSKRKVTQSNNNNKILVNTSQGRKNHTKMYGRQRMPRRRFLSTVSTEPSIFNNTKYEIAPTNINYSQIKKYFFNDKDIKSPRLAVIGETNIVKTKKYFFDSHTNYQNWSLE